MVLDESVLDLLSPEHIYPNVCTQMINTNEDKNMYNIPMFFVYYNFLCMKIHEYISKSVTLYMYM